MPATPVSAVTHTCLSVTASGIVCSAVRSLLPHQLPTPSPRPRRAEEEASDNSTKEVVASEEQLEQQQPDSEHPEGNTCDSSKPEALLFS